MIRLLLLFLWMAVPALAAPPRSLAVPVAAAADLRLALPAIVQAQEARTGQRFSVSYGSSGQMVQQAMNGAPFQLLLLADASHADRLARAVPGTTRRAYALGRLALVATRASGVTDLASLQAALAAGRIRHLAIANPAHAPYGAAAQAVLAGQGITAPLVLGENVAQAMSFVASGAAEAGLVALPLAKQAGADLLVVPVSPRLHPPLVQTLVLMPGAGPAARGLADRLTGPQGRAALARAGLGLP